MAGDCEMCRLIARSITPPQNNAYSEIEIMPEMECKVWGVMASVINKT